MAIGDTIQLKLMQKALTSTPANSSYTNAGANYKTTVTSLSLVNTGSLKRTVSVYLYGTSASNEILRIPVFPGGTEALTALDYVLSGTEAIYLAQDDGTDVNCAVMGLQEVIA